MLVVCSVDDWLAGFDVRISPFVNLKITLEEEEVVKLGKKNEDQYPLMPFCCVFIVVTIM